MKKIVIVISNGFEEIEAVTIIDICRRASLDVTIASVENILTIGAHNIKIEANIMIEDINYKEYDMVVLPGGLPNAYTLAQDSHVQQLLKDMKSSNQYIAAICAAPFALHQANVLNQNYTCYPEFEQKIRQEGYHESEDIVIDNKVITSRGPATAMKFSLEIVKLLCHEDTYMQVKSEILFK